MYSPVLLSRPTTSGSPPVLSISLSDHSFSALASSFACTLSHSRPLWRFMFFSKRAFNALSSSSRCSGDKSFLLLLMFRALVALMVIAARVSYLLLRCAPPHGFFRLVIRRRAGHVRDRADGRCRHGDVAVGRDFDYATAALGPHTRLAGR